MPDAISIGLSALRSHQRAIEVSAHNIANSATPGYSRQKAELSSALPESIKPGQLGRGVNIEAIRRAADSLLNDRLRQSAGEAERLRTLKENLALVEQSFSEPGSSSLSAATNSLFAALQDLSNNPESPAIRSTVVQSLETWTSTVSDLALRMERIRQDLESSLANDIEKVNGLTASIATLNQQIRAQTLLGNNPNDLLDQRDQMLAELTGYLDVRVRRDPVDNTAWVDVGGHMLVGSDTADVLSVRINAGGELSVVNQQRLGVEPQGGRIGATYELYDTIIPGLVAELDAYVSTVAHALDARHATGTSNSFRATSFTSTQVVAIDQYLVDLDATTQAQSSYGQPGIPAAFAPSFRDADGNLVARNLTINVLDTVTGLAGKYVIRYDPLSGGGGRSLDDLITAINTGRGGGFTLYPPSACGVAGVNATRVQVDGGFKLQLQTDRSTLSMDFSIAEDTQPTLSAWTGGAAQVAGAAVPALPVSRLQVRVDATGANLALGYRDPANGTFLSLGSVAVPGVGAAAVTVNGLTLTVPAGTYRPGDSFAVDLDAGGNVLDGSGAPGPYIQATQWTAGDASATLRGRYTGQLSYVPGLEWSVEVQQSGVVGAKAGTAPPLNPPQVQITYWTGTPEAPVRQIVLRTLDETMPAGNPIPIGDGLYLEFGSGNLSAVGNRVDFLVDGSPDQAGLLPALGINGMFKFGQTAASIQVADRLLANPDQLGVAQTRNMGDNANLRNLIRVRELSLFNDGSFTMDDYYQNLVSGIGVRIQQATRMGENQESLKASLEGQREAISGVNLDEEVGGLVLQQQAYAAAARIITTARENIQTLLDMVR